MDISFESAYRQFQDFFSTHVAAGIKIGIGLSGGPDSILLFHYLCRFMNDFPGRITELVIIHIIDGHQLIDNELVEYVKNAKKLVYDLSSEYNIPIVCYENTDLSLFDTCDSIESVCHTIRKKYFVKAIETYNLDYICLGHNQDDQIEHFFIGVLRKSSLSRIAGMDIISEKYIRPLLFLSKHVIQNILKKAKYFFCHDPCNMRTEYLRNGLRNLIIPSLEKIDSRFRGNLLAIMSRMKDQNDCILKQASCIVKTYGNTFNIDFFLDLDDVVRYYVLEIICAKYLNTPMTEAFYKECMRFLCHKKSIVHKVKKIYIYKKNKTVIFETCKI